MSKESAVEFKVENGKFIIHVDPNKDGQNVVSIVVDLTEVPDEVVAIFKKD